MENAEQQQGSANNTPRSQSSNTEGGSTQEEQEFMQETQLQPEYQLAFFANYKHDGDDGGPQAVGAGGSTEGDNNTPEVKPSTHVVAMSFDYDQMELTQVTDFLDPDFDADSSKQPSPIKSVVMQTIPPGKQQPKTLSPKQLVSQPQLQPQPQPLPLQIADPIPMPLPIPQPQQQQQQLPIPIPIPLQAQSLPRDINPGLIPQLPQQKQIQSLPNMHPHRIDSQQQQQQPVFKAPQPSIPPLNIIPHPVPKNSFEIDPSALILEPKPFASGGFADVYKGTYKGMQVAVKRLKQSDLSPESLEDFRKEVSILSLLRHENLVGFVGACTIPTHMCMVFEFVESGSLFDALYKDGCVHSSPHNSTSSTGSANSTTGTAAGGAQQQQQPQIVNPQRYRVYKEIRKQPPVLKMRILKQIAAACLYLHTPDQATNKPCVVHRDLKPENVMLDKNLNVKLSDFGLSRTKSQHSSVKTKHIAGTCMYMSPEALDGESVTEKVDVYAYGMIMWEMCSHAPPWTYPKKLSDPQIIAHVLQNKRPPLPKDTNPALAALIQECWHQDPAQRPSFAEILKRLDAMMPT